MGLWKRLYLAKINKNIRNYAVGCLRVYRESSEVLLWSELGRRFVVHGVLTWC